MNVDAPVPADPYKDVLRFLEHQLTAAEVSELGERLRGDETARRQAAALLLQIGTFGELARNPGEDRLPVRPQPPARWPMHRWIAVAAGACALAAALLLVIGKPRLPVRPHGGERQFFARRVAAPRAVVEVGSAGSVLLIRGGEPEAPDAPDLLIVGHLEALGFEVVQATESAVVADDLAGRTLVVISASTSGQVLRGRLDGLGLRESAVPIVTCESSTYDLLGLTGPRVDLGQAGRNGYGSTPNHDDVAIETPGHPLAAGLSGQLRIARVPVAISWGAPADSAIKVANLGGIRDNPMSVQFAYEKGSTMVGLVAPARRVACFISADAPDRLTAEGWRLFEAGVRWAAAH